jgi:penicillin-binding protein-related factor A (putative recombinase)
MKAKEFEELCLYRMRKHEERGEATMSRYGVSGSYMQDPATHQMNWRPISSLPDFEGLLPGGRQFIFDCKVCGAASFPLDDVFFKRRQLRHMLTRARFGGICFLLIHFTKRILKRGVEPAETWAFPVFASHPLWAAFDRGETKRITREDCKEYGVQVYWDTLPGGRTPRPDILNAIRRLEK